MTKGAKVALRVDPLTLRSDLGGGVKPVRFALPYFKGLHAKYFHRVRSACNHWQDGKLTHTSVNFWCGAGSFMRLGRLYPALPEDGVLCATCHGRAIGAGLDGERVINGAPVRFSPRRYFDGK